MVTNFWDPESMGKETEQGRKLVDAAKKEGVDHFVYSSLPNCQKLSRGMTSDFDSLECIFEVLHIGLCLGFECFECLFSMCSERSCFDYLFGQF